MHIVVKGTKTIDEFKNVQKSMENRALRHFESHKNTCENWIHGDIEKVWYDFQGNLCIEYSDGEYWHYNDKGEWW